jgi:quinol monooxygenase YgiN
MSSALSHAQTTVDSQTETTASRLSASLWRERKENELAIKVIVELQSKPGMRAELKSLLESMVANQGSNQPGFLGSTRYEVLDNPDALVEIADWESAGARVAHMEESAATGAYAPLIEMLATPFRATVIRELP